MSVAGAGPATEGGAVRRTMVVVLAVVALGMGAVACSSDGDGGGDDAAGGDGTTTTIEAVDPVDYAARGPYAVGEVDLQLDDDHQIAVFYPVDRDDMADDATPYSYSGEDIFGPDIVQLLPGALSGEIAPPDTYVDVPAAEDGPFPLVVFSHGAAGNMRFYNMHNSHVASWGYVVAAVDHPERGVVALLSDAGTGTNDADADAECEPPEDSDESEQGLDVDQLMQALDLLSEETSASGSPLQGVVDLERVAAEGQSAGAGASGTLAYDPRIDLWIGHAPVPPLEPGTDTAPYIEVSEDEDGECDFEYDTAGLFADTSPPPVPSMLVAAEGDTAVEIDGVEQAYEWLDEPKRLIEIADSGHAVWTDPCPLIQAEGGLSAFVSALGLDPEAVPLVELGENGCLPEDTPAETVWPFIDHVTVAQLNDTFDIDRAAAVASLDADYLAETFPDRFGSEQSEP